MPRVQVKARQHEGGKNQGGVYGAIGQRGEERACEIWPSSSSSNLAIAVAVSFYPLEGFIRPLSSSGEPFEHHQLLLHFLQGCAAAPKGTERRRGFVHGSLYRLQVRVVVPRDLFCKSLAIFSKDQKK